jgi:hypothetical protein
VDNIVLAGNINLNRARRSNVTYGVRCLMLAHDNAVADSNMRYLETGVTYLFHGQHVREDGEMRGHKSVLDHICVNKDLKATTDHSPIVASMSVYRVAPNRVALTTKSIKRRNFKALKRPAVLQALDSWPWSDIYQIKDLEKVLDFVSRGIVHGLDQAAPMKLIMIKEGSLPLYF